MIQEIERYVRLYGCCFIDENSIVIHPKCVRQIEGTDRYFMVSPRLECKMSVDDGAMIGATIKKLYKVQ